MSRGSDFVPTARAIGAALGAGLAATAACADGPGMLLSSFAMPGSNWYGAPFTACSRLGQMGRLNLSVAPLTAIGVDGRLRVYAPVQVPWAYRPPAGLGTVRDAGHADGFIVAIDASFRARAWGVTPPAWLPSEPLVDLAVASDAAAAVGLSGQMHLWNAAGPIVPSTVVNDAARVAIVQGWGAAVRTSGETVVFGFGGMAPPALPVATGVRDVIVAGEPAAPRAVALRTDGSIASIASPFAVAGSYEKIAATPLRLLALAPDGTARYWDWNAAAGDWSTTASDVPGRFDDIAMPPVSTGTAMFMICSRDAFRDGVPDAEQILRGELPDVNGDLVDDRAQNANVLVDSDANGTPDAAEVASTSPYHQASVQFYYLNLIGGRRVGFYSAERVPPQARLARQSVWRAPAHNPQNPLTVPAQGLPVTYSLSVDPNGDGAPDDAVEILRKVVTIEPDGVTAIDLEGVFIGPPGTVFFQGVSWDVPGPSSLVDSTALFAAKPGVIAVPSDPLAASRLRGRARYQALPIATAPAHGLGMLRACSTFEPSQSVGFLWVVPMIPVIWGDRMPGDCNGDGLLDSAFTGSVANPWWAPALDLDADNDGVIDSCELDCDDDGVLDLAEILAGSEDCDRDMVPDECRETAVVRERTAPVPAPGAPVEFEFFNLPPATGAVTLSVEAVADLGAPTEALLLRIDNGSDVTLFGAGGSDCPAVPDATGIAYTAKQFEAVRADGVVRVRIASTTLVDPAQCASGFVRVRLSYEGGDSDCDGDGTVDRCQGGFQDCNRNFVPDACELVDPLKDLDANGILDACELDCDRDGVPDATEIAASPALDCDGDGFIDACGLIDCNANGLHDPCEVASGAGDCNGDGVPDSCQSLPDCDGDGEPDACEVDCDGNGLPDACEIAGGASDKDADGRPDACEYAAGDFDLDGIVGAPDLAYLLSVWGATGVVVGDLNDDARIDAQDVAMLLARWGAVP